VKIPLGDTHESAVRSPTSDIRSDAVPLPIEDKHTSWSTFLRPHRECIAATDFFSVEVCTLKGLITHYVLVIDISSRTIKIAGITPNPDTRWMMQIARNLIDTDDGFLRGTRYLILDRDTKYTEAFCDTLEREGMQIIRLPPTIAEFERVPRAVRTLNQIRVLEPGDLLQ
jgi:hypothetical protein